MKKIFTTMLLTLCAFIGLNAQKFEFRMNGEPVDDGETVTFYGKKHIVKPQYNFMTSDILSVHNLTDTDINYSVVDEVLENTMEAFDLQIAMGGYLHIFEGNTFSFDAYMALPANGSAATLFNATSKLTTGHMLTKLTVTDGLESHSVIILFENSNTVKIDNLWYKLDPLSKVAEVTKSIETNPYYGDIEIPSSVDYNGDSYAVNKIGDYAFYNSSGLTSVVIPNSIETIGNSAFSGCI